MSWYCQPFVATNVLEQKTNHELDTFSNLRKVGVLFLKFSGNTKEEDDKDDLLKMVWLPPRHVSILKCWFWALTHPHIAHIWLVACSLGVLSVVRLRATSPLYPNSSHLTGLLWGLNEMMHVALRRAHSTHSINRFYFYLWFAGRTLAICNISSVHWFGTLSLMTCDQGRLGQKELKIAIPHSCCPLGSTSDAQVSRVQGHSCLQSSMNGWCLFSTF